MSRRRILGAGVGYAVGGPAGAVLGAAMAGDGGAWHDLRDVPFGIHVEAEVHDDDEGRRWTLTFHSEVPPRATALLQLRDDSGKLVPGQPPFADAGGMFGACSPIVDGQATLYAPFGAARVPPGANVSLEVTVFRSGDEVAPVGRATLDGDLPRIADDAHSICMEIARDGHR